MGVAVPPAEWEPDPSWPLPPSGWAFYVDDAGFGASAPTGAWNPGQWYRNASSPRPSDPAAGSEVANATMHVPSAPDPAAQWGPPSPSDVFPVTRAAAGAPPGSTTDRRRVAIVVGAVVIAGIALIVGGLLFMIGLRGPQLPQAFAGGKLLSSTEQYARDLADGDPAAREYPGKPKDYRKHRESMPPPPSEEGPALPVQPTGLLVGRYDRGGDVDIRLTRYAVDKDLWQPYVQQRLVETVMGDSRVAVAKDISCYPQDSESDYAYVSCLKVVKSGYWVASVTSSREGTRAAPDLQQARIVAEMKGLR